MIRPLSDDEKRANWAACRKSLRRYLILPIALGLLLLWGAGYGQGILAGYREHCGPDIATQGLTR